MGILLNIRFPGFIGKWLTRTFAKIYKINLNEAEKPIEAYKSIGDLFIRKLKPGLRPVKGDLV
ncbi:MAG: phosphatidylserine decarboxylase, partial [Bdellovibrionales bacterium]|nr:phosphatidylserine decarboxylase [Bdellovibrionales bacterium]